MVADRIVRRVKRTIVAVALVIVAKALSSEAFALAMCKLPPNRCRVVLQEMRQLDMQEQHDYAMLTGLRPYQRRMAVIERNSDRMRARIRSLPKDVGDELARLSLCDAKDRLAGTQGTFNTDPTCR